MPFLPDGIAVSQPPVFAARESVSRIYEEGKMFGGIESVGQAEAWLAPIVAAHVSSTIPVQRYINEASRVFGVNARLSSKYDMAENFPPQVVLWWKRKGRGLPGAVQLWKRATYILRVLSLVNNILYSRSCS